jgi:PAS domain S-box-containing protein
MTPSRRKPAPLVLLLAVAAAYFVTGRLGLMLPAMGENITLIWLPTGIAVAALVRYGLGCWPGVALGATAVVLALGVSWPIALGIAVGNTLGPVTTAWILRRFDFRPELDRQRDILWLTISAMLGMSICATGGVTTLTLAGVLQGSVLSPWMLWWAGDTLGVIIAAPLVFAASLPQLRATQFNRAEFALWLCITVLVTWAVFILSVGPGRHPRALAFVPLTLVAWAALRYGPVGTSVSLIVISVGAAYGTAVDVGPFSGQSPVEGATFLWIFMATAAALGWVTSALHSEKVRSVDIQRVLEQALSDVSLGVTITGLDRRITYVNQGSMRLTGYSAAEVLGESYEMLQGQDTDPATVRRIEAALESGESFDGEILDYRKDGSSFWNALMITPAFDERGKQVGFLGIQRDITKQKEAQAALRESEERYRRIIETTEEGVWTIDVNAKTSFVNPRMAEMLGYSMDEMMGAELQDFMDAEGRAISNENLERRKKGISEQHEFKFLRKDGTPLWAHLSTNPILDANGEYVGALAMVTDMGERKAAQEALRASESQFRSLARFLPVGVFRTNADGEALYVNEAWCEMAGMTPEQAMGMGWVEAIHADDRERVSQEWIRATKSGAEFHTNYRMQSLSGKVIRVHDTAVALRDRDGEITGFLGSVTDVTQRRRVEVRTEGERAVLELLASAAPLSEILDRLARSYEEVFPGMLCSVLLLDDEGRHLRHGAAPSLPREFCEAVNGIEIGPSVGSCGTAAFTQKTTLTEDIATDPRWDGFQELASRHDLKACWSVPVKSSRGHVLGTLAVYSRITGAPNQDELAEIERGAHFAGLALERHDLLRSLRESQERLETLVSNLPGMAYRCRKDGVWKMTYVSEGCEAITGYRREELEENRVIPYSQLMHEEDRHEHLKRCRTMIDDHRSYQGDYRLIDRHGRERWIHESASGVYDDDGNVLFVDGFIQDITAARNAKVEREQLDRKVRETQKLESLGVLAGGIAHDFNNLLASVLGNASLAAMDLPPDSPIQEHIQQITEASVRAAELCNQMLAYSGKGRFVVETIDLGRLVEETAQMLRISISKKAMLRFHLESGLPSVEVDATQIRQVIMNLVINASEAIGDESGVITLSTGEVHVDAAYLAKALMDSELAEGDYVYLEVTDNGCGMSPVTRAKIFDPFFTTKFAGRGLGLAAVLGIARGHKGALEVQSELGRGTTFRIFFPAKPVIADDDVNAPEAGDAWSGDGTVLVADDEPAMRKILARMLRKLGLDPVLVADGQEALETFQAEPSRFALVLLDLTMPNLDGEQTFAELRRLRPDIRIVLMSGYNAQEAIQCFTGDGPPGFLQKPFTVDSLREVLQSALS